MGCRSDYMEPTKGEYKQTNEVNSNAKLLADRLVFSCDVLRETILGQTPVPLAHINRDYRRQYERLAKAAHGLYVAADAGLINHVLELVKNYEWLNGMLVEGTITSVARAEVNNQQVLHRKADLARLLVSLAKAGDTVRLRKVLDADPSMPLDPQLGFSPDDF